MNVLAAKYGDKVNILGFPCNQFGHQTNEGNDEFLNTIKHVRPGGGFEIDPAIAIFEKGDVNGARPPAPHISRCAATRPPTRCPPSSPRPKRARARRARAARTRIDAPAAGACSEMQARARSRCSNG